MRCEGSNKEYARVAELADAHVWGACGFHRTGSSPVSRTNEKHQALCLMFFVFNKYGTWRGAVVNDAPVERQSRGRPSRQARPSPVSRTKNRQVSTCRFFIHCKSNGISSRGTRVSHHRRCISSAVGCIVLSQWWYTIPAELMICKTSFWWYTRLRRDLCKGSNSYAKTAKISFLFIQAAVGVPRSELDELWGFP